MTLRGKTLLITTVTLAVLFFVLASIARTVWYASFDSLEADRVELDVRRVAAALADEIDRLDAVARDWAEWDDSYAYIEDGNEAYVKSNLSEDTFERLGVDVMAFVHTSGRVPYFRAFDRVTKEPLILPADVAAALQDANSPVVRGDGTRGLVSFSDRVAMVVSRPILGSQKQGPARGKLILMRFADERVVSAIAHRTHVNVETFHADAVDIPLDVAASRAAGTQGDSVRVETRGEDTIAGYSAIPDVKGRPALLVRVVEPRSIHLEAAGGFKLLMGALVATGVVFGGLTLLLLERFVLVRLARLAREAREVGTLKDRARRVSVQGRDELAATALAINGMLASLEE